jgi:hypothetical protein
MDQRKRFLGSKLQTSSIPIGHTFQKGPATSTGFQSQSSAFGSFEEIDFYVATPHPSTEPYKDFSELLSELKQSHRIDENDRRLSEYKDSSDSSVPIFKPVARRDITEELDTDFGALSILRESSPIPFSPIRRSGNPLPLNSPFERHSPGFFEFPIRKYGAPEKSRNEKGQELRGKSTSPLVK